jgi:ABC-2 type transport system permease protein
MNGVFAFTRFELVRLLRSWKFLAITVGFPVVFYMLFLGERSSGQIIDGTVPWRVYLMVSMCTFGTLVAALNAGGSRLATERSTGWARQLRITPMPAWSYVVTKVTASMLVVLPVLVLVELVGLTFGGVRLGVGQWLALTGLLWVTAIPFAVLGVFVGFMVTAETAYPVVTALMFILGYFGGLFNPVSQMPQALQSAAKALPSFNHALLALDFLSSHTLGAANWLILSGYTIVLGMALLWKHRVEESRGLA